MTVDQLKAEARSKPSGVAFRKLSSTVYISVKYIHYPESRTTPEYTRYVWTCGNETDISEARARKILENVVS